MAEVVVEARSGHPPAEALLCELERRGLANDMSVEEFENLDGRGMQARVGGREVLVGTRRPQQKHAVPLKGWSGCGRRARR